MSLSDEQIKSARLLCERSASACDDDCEHFECSFVIAEERRTARLADLVPALLDEVERLTRERDLWLRQHDFVTAREKQIVQNLEVADDANATLKRLLAEALTIADEGWTALADDKWHEKHDRIAAMHREAGLPNE